MANRLIVCVLSNWYNLNIIHYIKTLHESYDLSPRFHIDPDDVCKPKTSRPEGLLSYVYESHHGLDEAGVLSYNQQYRTQLFVILSY